MMSTMVIAAPTLLLPLDGTDGGIGAVYEGGTGSIGVIGCVGWSCRRIDFSNRAPQKVQNCALSGISDSHCVQNI